MKHLVCIAVSIMLCAATSAAGPAKAVRIMPIGDSITEGGSSFSNWRYPLLEKLRKTGYAVEYVGSRTSPSPAGPLAHEGYGGKNAEFLATVVGKSFRAHPADIVLLHCGHNHFVEEKPVPGILRATESIIQSCRTVNPKVIILLAQVIPSGKQPKYSYIPELNRELAKLSERLNSADQPVMAVNQADGFDPAKDTVADKVHPNDSGAAKMRDHWFDALVKVMPKPSPSP